MNRYKLEVIAEIIGWKSHSDDTKLYFIKSYLTGWTTEEQIHEVTRRDGSRYVYGMRLRPAAPGAMPKDGLLQVDIGDAYCQRRRYWSLLTYERQLTEKECDTYDLDLLWTETEKEV